MGPSDDPSAIVNPELKVYGVKRLRVIDTSIIPASTTSHTSKSHLIINFIQIFSFHFHLFFLSSSDAASFMIGEVGADLIKKDWQRPSW